jgi:hypothetical protein
VSTGLILATSLQAFAKLSSREQLKKQVTATNKLANLSAVFEIQNEIFAHHQQARSELEQRFNLARQAAVSQAQLKVSLSAANISGNTPAQLLQQSTFQYNYNDALLDKASSTSKLIADQRINSIASRVFEENQIRRNQIPTLADIGLELFLENPYIQHKLAGIQ